MLTTVTLRSCSVKSLFHYVFLKLTVTKFDMWAQTSIRFNALFTKKFLSSLFWQLIKCYLPLDTSTHEMAMKDWSKYYQWDNAGIMRTFGGRSEKSGGPKILRLNMANPENRTIPSFSMGRCWTCGRSSKWSPALGWPLIVLVIKAVILITLICYCRCCFFHHCANLSETVGENN